VALDLPAEVRAALADWGAETVAQAGGGALRGVPPENLHLTLAFLGACEEVQAEAVGAVVRETTGAAPGLTLTDPLWLPPRRPHVLTVEVADDTGALAGLRASLIAALHAGAAFTPEARPFRPHVTVARVRRNQRIDADLPAPPPARRFAATALTLYRSHAGRYEPLARRPLL